MKQTATYGILREAVVGMRQVICRYDGLYREVCPHMLGQGKDGTDRLFTYQFAGQTSKGALPPGGEWRCFQVSRLEIIDVRQGAWHTGDSHLKPQSCVKVIDVEVPRR